MRIAFVPMDQRETAVTRRSGGFHWKPWAIGIAVVLLAILVAQNSQKVEVNFFFAETRTPLVFALLIAGALGAIIGWLAPRVRRHERDRRED